MFSKKAFDPDGLSCIVNDNQNLALTLDNDVNDRTFWCHCLS